MLKVLAALALGILSISTAGAKDALDYASLEGGGYSSVIAASGEPEFFFEDSVLSNFPTGSILGLIGEKKGVKKGAEVAQQYGIADPAVEISNKIANAISARLDLESTYLESGQVETPKMLWSMRKPRELADAFGAGKLVVDVRSTSWAVSMVGKDRYRVGYWANAQIVDTSTGKVLASSECLARPKKKGDLPFIATMLDNEAAELKAEIQNASNVCLNMFMAEMLGSQNMQ